MKKKSHLKVRPCACFSLTGLVGSISRAFANEKFSKRKNCFVGRETRWCSLIFARQKGLLLERGKCLNCSLVSYCRLSVAWTVLFRSFLSVNGACNNSTSLYPGITPRNGIVKELTAFRFAFCEQSTGKSVLHHFVRARTFQFRPRAHWWKRILAENDARKSVNNPYEIHGIFFRLYSTKLSFAINIRWLK